ncbi:lysylphosphatidylglycerol synthase transmembrane domain-containing protein [Pyrococcus kukulkanii]|uniref:Membrane protein n=1 Tax=Pyrococcus kukulkanii TaxID=1609559 RepID=A0A127B7F5_9EURY|nr:lysylphosphatidylglycerol synthase transmembrane domain-containing protein [Pyrococcus kukulkanii]AMM53175.1 membrane protein [Pyrococcus kukulkanii]
MNAKKYLTIIVGIGIIIVLLWWAGIRDSIGLMLQANLKYLALAVLMYCIAILSWSIRWGVFLRGANIRTSFIKVIEGVFVGIFLNNLTPGARTGGEAIKALYIAKSSNGTYPKVFATVMADRILDIIPVAMLMLIAFIYSVVHGIKVLVWVLLLSLILLMLVVIITVVFSVKENYAMSLIMGIFRIFRRIFPSRLSNYEEKMESKIKGGIREFKSTLIGISKRKRDVVFSTLWSFVLWLSDVLRTYFIFLSLGSRVSLLQVLLVKMASMALAMISVIPGGIGISETIQSALFLAVGVEKTVAVSATVLDRIISFWAPTFIGGVLVLKRKDVLRLDKLSPK